MRSRLPGVLLVLPLVVLVGSWVTPARAADPETVVLKAAHLFDGQSGTLRSPGIVVVRGKTIVATGENAEIPPGSRIVDLGNATLLPGYIDAHTHIAMDYSENWAAGIL